MTDDEDFYGGLLGDVYAQQVRDQRFGEDLVFERLATQPRGRLQDLPGLELGCGTGRMLLHLLSRDCVVEGIDVSEHMLALCRAAAASRRLEVTLHHATFAPLFESLHDYAYMYCPLNSFSLLAEDAPVDAALESFHEHLPPGGWLGISASGARPKPGAPELAWRHDVHLMEGSWRGTTARVLESRRPCRCDRHVEVYRRVDLRVVEQSEWLVGSVVTQVRRIWRPEDFARRMAVAGFRDLSMIGTSDDYVMVGHA